MKLIRKIAMPVIPYPIIENQTENISNEDIIATLDR